MADRAERVIRVDSVQPSQPASLVALLELCALYMSPTDVDLVRAAYAVADAAHAGALRKSGENFIEHPIAVARILAELAMDADGIAAALLHDTVEDTTLTLQQVRSQFGPQIAAIVDGVTKFTSVETDELSRPGSGHPQSDAPTDIVDARSQRDRKARQHSETVRKLFLAMSQEPRVVLLKLADRLHNMRTLGSMSAGQRETKARETLELFAPLAGRLGLYLFKAELEDLAFAHLDPERFGRVSQRLHDEAMKRSGWAERVAETLRRELAARNISVAVNWRIKHIYRAYREAEEHGMDVALLHDMIAFRIIVSSEQECYQALGAVHHLWHPHGDRIRDYLGTPKSNGYQSLHTAVFALDGRLAQLHIRTHLMHRAAQHGVAMYWLERAALGGVAATTSGEVVAPTAPVQIEEVMAWVHQLVGWHSELGMSASEFLATVKGRLLDEQIVVYTPRGDVRELPEGSTVLDLAYQIHTQVGDHAIGAFVHASGGEMLPVGRDVPIDHVLQRGDIVRIKTSPEAWPTADWREIAQTPYARERISRTLRVLRRGTKADGSLTPRDEEPTRESDMARQLQHPSGKVALVELARCCYPCPGDAIAGLAQSGHRVTVHRACCATFLASLQRRQRAGGAAAHALAVRWPNIQPITFRVHLLFEGQDHSGLMHEVSKCATTLGVNVSASSASSNRARYRAAIRLTLDLPPQMHVDTVLRSLRSVPGVVSVRRDTSKGCVAQPSEKP